MGRPHGFSPVPRNATIKQREIAAKRRDVLSVLDEWGEWEAGDIYAKKGKRSILATIGEGGGGVPGSTIPIPFIPPHVIRMGRAMADLKSRNEKRHQAVRLRYVRLGGDVSDSDRAGEMHISVGRYRNLLTEGIDILVELW